jgi:hypothetical protein
MMCLFRLVSMGERTTFGRGAGGIKHTTIREARVQTPRAYRCCASTAAGWNSARGPGARARNRPGRCSIPKRSWSTSASGWPDPFRPPFAALFVCRVRFPNYPSQQLQRKHPRIRPVKTNKPGQTETFPPQQEIRSPIYHPRFFPHRHKYNGCC